MYRNLWMLIISLITTTYAIFWNQCCNYGYSQLQYPSYFTPQYSTTVPYSSYTYRLSSYTPYQTYLSSPIHTSPTIIWYPEAIRYVNEERNNLVRNYIDSPRTRLIERINEPQQQNDVYRGDSYRRSYPMPPSTDSYRPRSEGSYDFQTADVKQGYAQHTNEVYNVGIPPRGPPSLPPGPPSFPSDPTSLPPGPPSLPTDSRSLPPGPPSHSYSEGSQYLQH